MVMVVVMMVVVVVMMVVVMVVHGGGVCGLTRGINLTNLCHLTAVYTQ